MSIKFDIDSAKWIKLNSFQSTFFRTQYDPFFLNKLANAVQTAQLPPVDRLGKKNFILFFFLFLHFLFIFFLHFYFLFFKGLQNDLFALSQSGRITTDKALEFALNYKHESENAGQSKKNFFTLFFFLLYFFFIFFIFLFTFFFNILIFKFSLV